MFVNSAILKQFTQTTGADGRLLAPGQRVVGVNLARWENQLRNRVADEDSALLLAYADFVLDQEAKYYQQ